MHQIEHPAICCYNKIYTWFYLDLYHSRNVLSHKYCFHRMFFLKSELITKKTLPRQHTLMEYSDPLIHEEEAERGETNWFAISHMMVTAAFFSLLFCIFDFYSSYMIMETPFLSKKEACCDEAL